MPLILPWILDGDGCPDVLVSQRVTATVRAGRAGIYLVRAEQAGHVVVARAVQLD